MRKSVVCCLILMVFLCFAPSANAEQTEIRIFVNGVQIQMDVAPIIVDGRTMVPLRAIGEALDLEVRWIEEYQTAEVWDDRTIVSANLREDFMRWVPHGEGRSGVGVMMPLDVPPMLYNGRTLVPLRAIAECFFAIVEWYEDERMITIEPIPMAERYVDWGPFREGRAWVAVGEPSNRRSGYIDRYGNEVIPLIFHDNNNSWSDFSEGLAAVRTESGMGYIDRYGNMVMPPIFGLARPFSEGLAVTDNGVIDRHGEVLFSLPAGVTWSANGFSEGRLAVMSRDGWGVIDTEGNVIVPFRYHSVGNFSEGFATVVEICDDRIWRAGYIDRYGNALTPVMFDQAVRFRNGQGHVRIGDRWYWIDRDGQRHEFD